MLVVAGVEISAMVDRVVVGRGSGEGKGGPFVEEPWSASTAAG